MSGYVFQAWPSWRYGPDGQEQIFQSAEEVPEGWVDHPNKLGKPESAPAPEAGSVGEREAKIADLVKDHSQADLAAHLELMQETKPEIEFAKNWPKQKLAETIVDNGGPIEEGE